MTLSHPDRKEQVMVYKRITLTSVIEDTATYVVLAVYKDTSDAEPFVKFTGSYDACADYVERNTSPDNVEAYFVGGEVVAP